MLFAMQHWQKQVIISRNNTIFMNFSPFIAIMRNLYHIHASSAGDLVHIIEKVVSKTQENSAKQVRQVKKPSPELRTILFSCCLIAIATESPMACEVRTAMEPLFLC